MKFFYAKVGYEAGSEGIRLPPLYMKSLDNELIKVLQKAVQGCEDTHTVLELIFYILETEKAWLDSFLKS